MLITAYVHAYVPYHNGGAETTLHELLKAMVARGHEAVVVIKETPYQKPGEYFVEGVKVIFSEDKRTILHYMNSDVLITHLECSVRATILGQKFHVPVVQLIHNNLDLTKRYVAHRPDLVVYNTDWIKRDFIDSGYETRNIVVHPPVIAERYKVDHGKKVTLVNLFERKGQDVFYALAERMPEYEFLAVKGGYGAQVERHDLPNVEIMDNEFDVRKVYEKTKIILMPSVYESYGRVAVEAAASGIPSIVSDTPGLREALGDSAIYVDRSDLNGWETALRSLLTPRKYGAMSKLALARSEALDVKSRAELDLFVSYMEHLAVKRRK